MKHFYLKSLLFAILATTALQASAATTATYFSDNFSWLTKGNKLGWKTDGEYRFDNWDAQNFENPGWECPTQLAYSRTGFVKLSKTAYDADFVTPLLKRIPSTQTVTLSFQAVGYSSEKGVRDKNKLYIIVLGGGTVKSATCNGKLSKITTGKSVKYFSYASSSIDTTQYTTYSGAVLVELDDTAYMNPKYDANATKIWNNSNTKFTITIDGASRKTRIVFVTGGNVLPFQNTKGISKSYKNRIFLDNVKVTGDAPEATATISKIYYKSRYDAASKKNVYQNKVAIGVKDNTSFNNLSGWTVESGRKSGTFDVWRKANDGTTAKWLGTIKFYDNSTNNKHSYFYKVTYRPTSQDTELLYDNTNPTAVDDSVGFFSYSAKAYFWDRFTASTAEGTQPTTYSYYVKPYTSSWKDLHSSDTIAANVPAVKATVALKGMTSSEVKADTVASVGGKVLLTATIDPDTTGVATVSLFEGDATEASPVAVSGNSPFAVDTVYSGTAESVIYYPQITLTSKYSYGGGAGTLTLPSAAALTTSRVEANKVSEKAKTEPFRADVTITPVVPDGYVLYAVHMWREVDGKSICLNNQKNTSGSGKNANGETETWGTNWQDLNGLNFTNSNPVTITDIYVGKSLNSCGGEKTATYRVRSYYAKTYSLAPAQGPSRKAAETADIIARETTTTVTYDANSVVTAVADVTAARQVASIRYYNLAGQQSTQPFQGLNLVRTTFTDGTTETVKLMK